MDKIDINNLLTDAVLELTDIEEAEENLDARRKSVLARVEKARNDRLAQH